MGISDILFLFSLQKQKCIFQNQEQIKDFQIAPYIQFNIFYFCYTIQIFSTIILLLILISYYKTINQTMQLLSSFSQQKLKSSYFNCSVLQSKPLCTIALTFQNESLSIPIYMSSKINKIADQISNNFCGKYQLNLNQQFEQIHSFICYKLAQQIRRVIITQDQKQSNNDNQWSDSLIRILASHLKFQQQKSEGSQNQQLSHYKINLKDQNKQSQILSSELKVKINKISYFQNKFNIQNTIDSFQNKLGKESKLSINKKENIFFLPINKNITKSKAKIGQKEKNSKLIQYSLYNKSKEILTRRKLNVISRQKEKLKTQTRQCTFHPDISLSSEKYKKKSKPQNNSSMNLASGKKLFFQQNTVFQKLYSNAQEIKSKKNFFRVKTEQAITLQENKQLTFAPKINECSKQIVKMKKKAYIPFYDKQNNQNWKQKTSTTYSDTQKFIQTDKKKKIKPLKQITLNSCNSSTNITVFEKLFKNETKKLQKNKQKQNNLYSFRPQLSKGTRKLLQQKDFPTLKQRVAVTENYFQKAVSKKSLMSIQKYLQELQLKEEQSNFRNIVIEDQQNQQQNQNNLNQYNHSLSSIVLNEDSNKKISSERSKIDEYQVKVQQPQVKKSQKLFNNRKNKIFHQIFIKLTQSQFGNQMGNMELTHKMIYNFKQFPETVKPIFIKIGEQMERLNVGLDEDEFVWSLSNTYQHLNLTEKGMLLGWGIKQLKSEIQE